MFYRTDLKCLLILNNPVLCEFEYIIIMFIKTTIEQSLTIENK